LKLLYFNYSVTCTRRLLKAHRPERRLRPRL